MINHECEACIVTCIDFRLQQYIDDWIKENFKPKTFDRVALVGGVKNIDVILEQIRTSSRLHGIKRAVFINHEDCGAYGEENISDKEAELIRHTEDLRAIADRVRSDLPHLRIETYYLHLDGTFEPVK